MKSAFSFLWRAQVEVDAVEVWMSILGDHVHYNPRHRLIDLKNQQQQQQQGVIRPVPIYLPTNKAERLQKATCGQEKYGLVPSFRICLRGAFVWLLLPQGFVSRSILIINA